MLKRIPRIVYPVLTSVLLVLAYPKFDLGWLAWGALGPLGYFLLKEKSPWRAAGGGLLCGTLAYLGILYWIYPTMRAGGVNPAVSALGTLLLALTLSAEFVVISLYGWRLRRAGAGAWPYLFAAGWFLLEYGKVLLARKAVWFPWFMLGYTQWEHTALIQVVSLTGIYGLSAAVCLTGALLGAALAHKDRPARRGLRLLPGLAVVGGLWWFGQTELVKAEAAPARSLSVSLLQPSIDFYAKWQESEAEGIKLRMRSLLSGVKGGLAVWPENALPCWIDEPDCEFWLRSAAAASAADGTIAGSVSKGGGRHVSAFLLDRRGEIKGSYDKRQLVPFGEYVPLRGLLGKFIAPVAALGEFDPGSPEQRLLEFNGVKLGVAICYESMFPSLQAEDARAGAEVFVNITNDGWYLDTAAPYQHLVANIFRAAETRRSVVRAANNGISAVIDPWGRVTASTALNEVTVLEAGAPLGAEPTFFTLYGAWVAGAALLLAAAFLLAVFLV